MTRTLSLRMRLTLIILIPLLVLAVITGLWQLENARRTATEVFDRSLLSAALAVANDVAISGGDALSARTEQILADTSGGRVFYHVYAPDGVIVAGYATPPVGIPRTGAEVAGPTYFKAVYLGRDVSGVRLQTRTEIEGFSGIFTTTVWQDIAVRTAFVWDLILRSLIAITVLISCVALVVWFGVRFGLRPLLDLEAAIEKRSSDDLSPIRRPVPEEVRGIVETLNALFAQVSRSMAAQSEFISNAAHQLRNPIAGVLALAEAVRSAPDGEAALARSDDLLEAAQEAADLSQQLLTLERAKSLSPASLHERIDLARCLQDWLPAFRSAAGPGVEVHIDAGPEVGTLLADPTMIREALLNLIDNAVVHGGKGVSRIDITAARTGGQVRIMVSDNGGGIPDHDVATATQRFVQLSGTSGSGLGLPIVSEIAQAHGGALQIRSTETGTAVRIDLPC